ncbi:MAG: hypothetical protein RIS48_2163, partial [Pseudomonadota bacterium]
MDFLFDPNIWIAFAMLTTLEIVLGVDNIIFISILVGRLPPEQRDKARRLGLGFAMISRLLLLASLSWIMGLKADLFSVFGQGISGRDIVLLAGGLFLLWKASHEIFVEVEAREQDHAPDTDAATLKAALNAAHEGLIMPVLIGCRERISALGQQLNLDLLECLWREAESPAHAASIAVEMARDGEVAAIMQGSIPVHVLMQKALRHAGGLRTTRRVSHAYLADVPNY